MLQIYLQAPFAACRTFTAGWHRPTAAFLTPSCVYGLLMNVAGLETRLIENEKGHDGRTPASLTRPDLPTLSMAIGIPARRPDGSVATDFQVVMPLVQSVYQQLHNYPVGTSAGTPAELAKGRKNNITPVRREFLSDVRAMIGVRGPAEIESRIVDGLCGRLEADRYGIPFLGDNQFLIDRMEVVQTKEPAFWFVPSFNPKASSPTLGVDRLTVWIDRADMSRTRSSLFAPSSSPNPEPPEEAWTEVGPQTDD